LKEAPSRRVDTKGGSLSDLNVVAIAGGRPKRHDVKERQIIIIIFAFSKKARSEGGKG
jgi:hypothetical protein